MKKKITISYSAKRTFSLGNYENIAPVYSVTEEIELDEGQDFTKDQYGEALSFIKGVCRTQMQEEAERIKQYKITK